MKARENVKSMFTYFKLLNIVRKKYLERGYYTRAYKSNNTKAYHNRYGKYF